MKHKIQAAVCILLNGTRVLAIKRRYYPIGYALPGGMVENNETPKQAAARELLEETGLQAEPSSLTRIYTGTSDSDLLVASYLVGAWSGNPSEKSDEGPPSWISWGALLTGAFPYYNEAVYRALVKELNL